MGGDGRGRERQAAPGHAPEGGVQRLPAQGARRPLPNAEIHQQTRQEEAGGEARPEGLPGKDALGPILPSFSLKTVRKRHFLSQGTVRGLKNEAQTVPCGD